MNRSDAATVTLPLTKIQQTTITDDRLTVSLEDERTISIPLSWYPRLLHGTDAERANMEICGAGYALHWPDLDETIEILGLFLGKKSIESATSFKHWLQRRKVVATPLAIKTD